MKITKRGQGRSGMSLVVIVIASLILFLAFLFIIMKVLKGG